MNLDQALALAQLLATLGGFVGIVWAMGRWVGRVEQRLKAGEAKFAVIERGQREGFERVDAAHDTIRTRLDEQGEQIAFIKGRVGINGSGGRPAA